MHLPDDVVSDAYRADLAEAAAHYVAHRFDLLGSGWVDVRHGMTCASFAGHTFAPGPRVDAGSDGAWLAGRVHAANLAESRRLWGLIDGAYTPIDWQLDFRSGYRWSETTHSTDIRFGDVAGADVKVPWDLARLQHLPQLALAQRVGIDTAQAFRNQVLDFLATNPPRYGVNWAGPMDVAIRIVNVLLALDLFRDAGVAFDPAFLDTVKRAAVEHARHVLAHLEWSEESRGNHYLAELAGVAFAGAYLPDSAETRGWLRFAAEQLALEADRQFLDDGGNFEASTNYHRLSGELVLYPAALLLGLTAADRTAIAAAKRPDVRPPPAPLDADLLPHATFAALAKAARFTRDVTKPDGSVVQIGDTDSGRFVKLQLEWNDTEENVLDHRSFVAAAATLTDQPALAAWAGDWVESAVVRALAGGRSIASNAPAAPAFPTETAPATILAQARAAPPDTRRIIELPLPADATADLDLVAYPHFGVYVLRGARLFLAARCPAHDSPQGHAHDDALAIELEVDGRALLSDPGSYAYTPLPDARNTYRAASAHSVPRPAGAVGADLNRGLFEIAGLPRGTCLYFGHGGFVGRADGDGWHVFRAVVLDDARLTIVDLSPGGPLAAWAPPVLVSPGYGKTSARPARAL